MPLTTSLKSTFFHSPIFFNWSSLTNVVFAPLSMLIALAIKLEDGIRTMDRVAHGYDGTSLTDIADAAAERYEASAELPPGVAAYEVIGQSLQGREIFAGSAGRSKLGMAEVELTLDNSSRVLPLDLNEVTISRSTDRAGGSVSTA